MSVWAVVPVKPFHLGKSRLRKVLSDEQRASLNHRLFLHTLETLCQVNEIDRVLVVSHDAEVSTIARQRGVLFVQEWDGYNLNRALAQATQTAVQSGCDRLLIMPADIPLFSVYEIKELIEKSVDPPVVVISPDRRLEGTNALCVSPPHVINYAFGRQSFSKHCENARNSRARLEILKLPGLSIDIDLPEDLDLVKNQLEILR